MLKRINKTNITKRRKLKAEKMLKNKGTNGKVLSIREEEGLMGRKKK